LPSESSEALPQGNLPGPDLPADPSKGYKISNSLSSIPSESLSVQFPKSSG